MNKSDALAHFSGSPTKLAEALGIKVQSLYSWGTLVPEHHARRLPEKSGGALVFDPSIYEAARQQRAILASEFGALGGGGRHKRRRKAAKV